MVVPGFDQTVGQLVHSVSGPTCAAGRRVARS
jgi:hypothetical protein